MGCERDTIAAAVVFHFNSSSIASVSMGESFIVNDRRMISNTFKCETRVILKHRNAAEPD